MLENLNLIGTGFAVVMLVLAALWGACALVGSFFIRAARPSPSTGSPGPARDLAPPAPAPASGVPPHHLAVIAAAVAHAFGAGARVLRVEAPPHKVVGWPLEGRFETVTAHRIRTDWGPTRSGSGGETPDILRGQQQ
jgi:glutaconyl-CoA/methylmalonyl-CoA decarboxylase subunit delta